MRAQENSLPLVYVNMVGGQDELVFDGGSVVVDAGGQVQFRAPLFEEGLYVVDLERRGGRLVPRGAAVTPVPPLAERVYRALVLGTRDYVEKNGFAGVVLGLVGRRRLGVDADDRRRRARRRPRARRHDAVALHLADEPRRRGAAGEAARRALRRAVDRADVRDDAEGAEGRVRRVCRPIRRKRTSRRAAAACC